MKPEKESGEAEVSDGYKAQRFYPQVRAVCLLPGLGSETPGHQEACAASEVGSSLVLTAAASL